LSRQFFSSSSAAGSAYRSCAATGFASTIRSTSEYAILRSKPSPLVARATMKLS